MDDQQPRQSLWIVLARRFLFFATLLLMGAVTASCFHDAFDFGLSPSLQNKLGTFAWGADSMGIVLAAWLAGRVGVWRSWSGWLRAVVYVLAYAHGTMLFSATQDWLNQPNFTLSERTASSFRWPGGDWDDFARPAIDLLSVLLLTWMLLPVFAFLQGYLAEERLDSNRPRTFSIAFLIGWTTIAAVLITWIQFLTSTHAPDTAFSNRSATQLLAEYLFEQCPESAVRITAFTMILVSWSFRWWLPIIVLPVAIATDGLGHQIIYAVLGYFGVDAGGHVLDGTGIEKWCYVAGRNCTAWIAFGTARLLSVRFYR